MIPLPNKKYQIVYADPPWKYDNNMRQCFTTDKII